MYTHLIPGGYAELSEISQFLRGDSTYNSSTQTWKYFEEYNRALKESGIPTPNREELVEFMKGAGFVDVKVQTFNVPYGTWPKGKKQKYVGATMCAILETGFVVSDF